RRPAGPRDPGAPLGRRGDPLGDAPLPGRAGVRAGAGLADLDGDVPALPIVDLLADPARPAPLVPVRLGPGPAPHPHVHGAAVGAVRVPQLEVVAPVVERAVGAGRPGAHV